MQLMLHYHEIMLEHDHRTLAPLIESMRTSSFTMDLKLAMIKQFLPKIAFRHVDMLVTNFKYLVERSNEMDGIFICNTNPFLVATTILDNLKDIKESFPLLKLRIH